MSVSDGTKKQEHIQTQADTNQYTFSTPLEFHSKREPMPTLDWFENITVAKIAGGPGSTKF